MELGPSWETTSGLATQELSDTLWNPRLQYPLHKSLPLDPILSQSNPGHTTPAYFSNIQNFL
jgi:hypothetical protein